MCYRYRNSLRNKKVQDEHKNKLLRRKSEAVVSKLVNERRNHPLRLDGLALQKTTETLEYSG